MRQVLYVAHPVAPTEGEIAAVPKYNKGGHGMANRDELLRRAVEANIQRALRWLAWLRKSFPETTFIAPWIATIQSLGGDGTPEEREAGLVDDCAVVERCDGIVLVGGRISSGMRREMEHGLAGNTAYRATRVVHLGMTTTFKVYDLTGLGAPPPKDLCNLTLGGVHANAFMWAGFEAERSLICLSRMGIG